MMNNLKYFEGKPDTDNQECQVIDYQSIENEEKFKRESYENQQKLEKLKKNFDSQTQKFFKKYLKQQLDYEQKEAKHMKKIEELTHN